jgi:hypothetical protein
MGGGDLRARVRRLEELSLGLSREIELWRKTMHPLQFVEREAYVGALGNAVSAAEEARVILAGAMHRIEDQERKRGSL